MLPPSNSLYYHTHITQSIDQVTSRTQKYIKHRKQFLKQYCSPLQQKIHQLDKEISFYKHLIENQNQLIQNQKDVVKLKQQIGQFKQTQAYFLEHIDQYQRQILQLNIQNEVIQQQITKLKNSLNKLTLQKTQQLYQQMNLDQKNNNSKSNKDQLYSAITNKSNIQSHNQNQNQVIKHNNSNSIINSSQSITNNNSNNNSRINISDHLQHKENSLLPTIFKVQKYYVNKVTSKTDTKLSDENQVNESHKLMNKNKKSNLTVQVRGISQLQQQDRHLNNKNNFSSHYRTQTNHQQSLSALTKTSLLKRQTHLKNKFKQCISSFNKFQILFKQCFDKKKTQVQKSVSQLQSRLITDREKFLQVCQAIGQKDIKNVSFDQFEKLSGDQLMTLFISFPWIQKKIFHQLNLKRKLIVQLQKNKFL